MTTDTNRQIAVAMIGTGLIVTAVSVTLAATGSLPEWGRATLMTVGVVLLLIGILARIDARQTEIRAMMESHAAEVVAQHKILDSIRHQNAEIGADLTAAAEQILAIAEICATALELARIEHATATDLAEQISRSLAAAFELRVAPPHIRARPRKPRRRPETRADVVANGNVVDIDDIRILKRIEDRLSGRE